MSLTPGHYAIVLNPGTDEQSIEMTFKSRYLAYDEADIMRKAGDTVDVMKIDPDGNLTAEF